MQSPTTSLVPGEILAAGPTVTVFRLQRLTNASLFRILQVQNALNQ